MPGHWKEWLNFGILTPSANLNGVYLSWANLSNADLSSAKLRNADLRNADLSYAGANLRNATLGKHKKSDLKKRGAKFS